MPRYLPLSLRALVGLVVLMGMFSYGSPADAAERVVLKYRFLRETISVRELRSLADTGEVSTKLQVYLKLAKRDPQELRRALTQEVKVNPNFLYRVLNTPVGGGMLDEVSQVIHTPSNRANRESLRSAIVSSALADEKITLIETLENYPTSEVIVEGDRLVEVAQRMTRVLGRLPSIPNIRL